MTLVKSKKFKVVMAVLFAIALFAFVNYNVWDYAKANSNDYTVSSADNQGPLGDHSDWRDYRFKCEIYHTGEPDSIEWSGSTNVFEYFNPSSVKPHKMQKLVYLDKNCDVQDDHINGNKCDIVFCSPDNYYPELSQNNFEDLWISLDSSNKVTLHYKTDTDDWDWDGEKVAIRFSFNIDGNKIAEYEKKWTDKSDNSHHWDSESFNSAEVYQKVCEYLSTPDEPFTGSLYDAVMDHGLRIQLENVKMSDLSW